jgi:S1-C subfamily serine protease
MTMQPDHQGDFVAEPSPPPAADSWWPGDPAGGWYGNQGYHYGNGGSYNPPGAPEGGPVDAGPPPHHVSPPADPTGPSPYYAGPWAQPDPTGPPPYYGAPQAPPAGPPTSPGGPPPGASGPGPPSTRRLWVLVAVVAAVIGGLVGGGIGARTRGNSTSPAPAGVVTRVAAPNTQLLKPQSVPAILAKVEPGVASVHTNLGAGTGMILTASGQVLTNYHVVQGASSIKVTLFNESTARTATLQGFDQANDVAILQIPGAAGLPTVQLGNSDSVQVGDDVVAVGNALNLVGGPTVTAGIISAKGRTVDAAAPQNLLQTDAAINPGNSGGPLVNANGQVVGMNTLVIQQANSQEAAQNLGFAIPINTIKPLVPDLAKGIQRTPGYLGVGVVTLTPDIAQRFGITATQGAVIQDLPATGPAAQAGLQQTDVITSFDGQPVTSDSGLVQLIHDHKPGDHVQIGYVRGSNKGTVTVTLGAAPSQ